MACLLVILSGFSIYLTSRLCYINFSEVFFLVALDCAVWCSSGFCSGAFVIWFIQ